MIAAQTRRYRVDGAFKVTVSGTVFRNFDFYGQVNVPAGVRDVTFVNCGFYGTPGSLSTGPLTASGHWSSLLPPLPTRP